MIMEEILQSNEDALIKDIQSKKQLKTVNFSRKELHHGFWITLLLIHIIREFSKTIPNS